MFRPVQTFQTFLKILLPVCHIHEPIGIQPAQPAGSASGSIFTRIRVIENAAAERIPRPLRQRTQPYVKMRIRPLHEP